MASTHLRSDHGLAKAIVHVVDQKPRATVRHAERDTGFGDRSGVTDRFQQPNLAGPDRPIFPEIDAQGQPRRCQSGGSYLPTRPSLPIEPVLAMFVKSTVIIRVIVDAIYAATGMRLRNLPMSPPKILAEIDAEEPSCLAAE
jgi:hypothetical protein